VSAPAGRGAAWTEERATREGGASKAPRRLAREAQSAPTGRGAAPPAADVDPAARRGAAPPASDVDPVGDSAVRCAGLTYRFGDHVAVDHVDLEIAPGETFGLLGPNGAGKTTTIRMLTTLLKPALGSVMVFGTDARSSPMRVRRMIGYVPQLLSADATLTGRENVELYARLFDVPRRLRADRVDGALAAMGLTEPAQRLVKTYSGGMIRRLELAQALVSAPRLLVLDEPTVGLDPIARSCWSASRWPASPRRPCCSRAWRGDRSFAPLRTLKRGRTQLV
jgi:ABC-type Na+ transport system ATPase subunit NatA